MDWNFDIVRFVTDVVNVALWQPRVWVELVGWLISFWRLANSALLVICLIIRALQDIIHSVQREAHFSYFLKLDINFGPTIFRNLNVA